MAKMSFGSRGGRVRRRTVAPGPSQKSPEEVVRELKSDRRKPPGEDYRERSLALHGPICARCGREFEGRNRHLLTVHHRDGNHHNNPPDGSNWENLCVDCHDQEHGRGVHADLVDGATGEPDRLVHSEDAERGSASLGDLLQQALARKGGR